MSSRKGIRKHEVAEPERASWPRLKIKSSMNWVTLDAGADAGENSKFYQETELAHAFTGRFNNTFLFNWTTGVKVNCVF